ncbi:MAG: hypothetical protein ACI9O2_001246 [Flammeovirgaceae bacterium]
MTLLAQFGSSIEQNSTMKKHLLILSRNQQRPEFWYQFVDRNKVHVSVCNEINCIKQVVRVSGQATIIVDDYFSEQHGAAWMCELVHFLVADANALADIICLSPRFASLQSPFSNAFENVECYSLNMVFLDRIRSLNSSNLFPNRA